MKTCSEVMTSALICCLETDSVQAAAMQMKRADVGAIPVVENYMTKMLVGIVTDRDLVLGVIAMGRHPEDTPISDVMSRDLATCRGEDSLDRAVEVMLRRQVRRLPVVDDGGHIVGIITQGDIATRGGAPVQTAQFVEEISRRPGSSSGIVEHHR
jgi:CBS domain-containing protein